jgi:hypothetical protein
MFKFLPFPPRKKPEIGSEDDLKAVYERRRDFAKEQLKHDPLALEKSLDEIEVWLRKEVKGRTTTPL